MKYQYRFGTGFEDVELDEEWVAVLKDFDRSEGNQDRRQRRYTALHYDALEFTPDFMGKEDDDLVSLLDGTPAFEYAIDHLLPRHREILYRRAAKGEMFKDIGKAYGVTASAIHHYYTNICTRFKKYYKVGLWLHSSRNVAISEAGKVRSIPFGMTPAQVMAIRAYRSQLCSVQEIAELVGISESRVKRCLQANPVLETRCPACGKPISQTGYGVLQKFCNDNCYYSWFRQHGMDAGSEVKINKTRERLSRGQQMALDYYRQQHLTLKQMHIVTGISEQFISAYCYAHPLPYTLCLYCGKQVPGEPGKWNMKYCSTQCRNRYLEKQKKIRKRLVGRPAEPTTPTLEQLCYAVELRDNGLSYAVIETLTGVAYYKLRILFRFDGGDK